MASKSTARILLYTATALFRHESIPTSIQALKEIGPSINVIFDNTEDKSQFTDSNLALYDAVMFVSTSGEILDEAGKAAFQRYLNLGGNFIGVHCAAFTLMDTPFYKAQLGALFDYHPDPQSAIITVTEPNHPSTSMLPVEWRVMDELYNFRTDPREVGSVVILSVDESSYSDPGTRKFDHGDPHPIAWYQERGAGVQEGGIAGRSFYTSLGHFDEIWRDPLFMAHVAGGISWVLQSKTTRVSNPLALVGNSQVE